MGSAPNLFFGQCGKPALDLVKPRSRCWSEMDMKTRMTSEPSAHGRRLVSPVVVHHQMHLQLRRDVGFDRTQELQELNAAMAPMQLADDFSGSYIQGREQRRGAMAFVIVRTALGYAGGQRQNWLSPVQCLNMALLVHKQHNGLGRRIEIQTDDVTRLGNELRIGRQLEGFLTMRLQAKRAPDPTHRRLRQTTFTRHGARAPMCRFGRLFFQCLGNECIDPSIINGAWRTCPGRVEQSIKSLLEKARTPFRYCLRRDAKRVGYDFVAGATDATQNHARARGEHLSCLAPTRPGLQLLTFRFTQHQLRFRSTSHRASVVWNQLYDGQHSDQ